MVKKTRDFGKESRRSVLETAWSKRSDEVRNMLETLPPPVREPLDRRDGVGVRQGSTPLPNLERRTPPAVSRTFPDSLPFPQVTYPHVL